MLRQRILTALVLAPLALAGLFGLSGGSFAAFTALVLLLGAWEWARLAGFDDHKSRLLYTAGLGLVLLVAWWAGWISAQWPLWIAAAGWLANAWWVSRYPQASDQWQPPWRRLAMGGWVLVPCWVGLYQLRQDGSEWLLFVLLLVWVADIGAYFSGRRFGRRKLAPHVSPGKSWEGVYGGWVAVAVLVFLYALWLSLDLHQTLGLLIVALIVAFISVVGDLLESMLKRFRGLKDSSHLLPGHGGILDRIDSLTAAVPLFALIRPWLG
ncbi:phosphatidate cytidylyltransferase [Salinicola halimionae]|uniref:phosphatidate cytidylyltransferase n=1 Tax=Salinicola halimionae TaxID=1949081 RepID=UPI000DA24275|nr:phosphatidate cytidylyltransferase [Salinicola halimionae]